MSTLKVDSLVEKTSGNGVHIAGHVIQVVNATYGTQANSSSSSFTDTGLTATITPKSSSSKILISANITGVRKLSNNTFVQLRLVKNSSGLIHIESSAGRDGTTGDNAVGSVSTSYLDSPATTSATIYKVQFSSANNNAEVVVQVSGNTASTSTITLMEIAQ